MFEGEVIMVLDTKKENDLIIHIIDRIPDNIDSPVYGPSTVRLLKIITRLHTYFMQHSDRYWVHMYNKKAHWSRMII